MSYQSIKQRLFRLCAILCCAAFLLCGWLHPVRAEDYIKPTLLDLVHTLVRFGAVDLSDDELILDYSLLAECDLYIKYYRDDFKWHEIIRLLRQKLTNDIPSYPTSYYIDMKMQLDRYDFDEKLYRFTLASTPKNANSFVVDDEGKDCGTKSVSLWPLSYKFVLNKSVTIPGLPFFENDAKLLLERLNKAGNTDHIIYARWGLRITKVPSYIRKKERGVFTSGLRIDGLGQNIEAQLGLVYFYEDPGMKRLIYVFKP